MTEETEHAAEAASAEAVAPETVPETTPEETPATKTTAEIAQDEGMLAAPNVYTRPSLLHLVFGNALLLGLLYAFYIDTVPNWLIVIAGLLLFFLGAYIDGERVERFKKKYYDMRGPEVAEHFPDETARREFCVTELRQRADLSPSYSLIALPLLPLALSSVYFVFVDVNMFLRDWFWLLRWAVAALAALPTLIVFFCVWAEANLVLGWGRIDGENRGEDNIAPDEVNDVQIIRQLASLTNLQRRIEAYQNEGALLSALSFASFLAIVTQAQGMPGRLADLALPRWESWHLPEAVDLPLLGKIEALPSLPIGYVQENLLPLICLSLLFCATTFLGVLVARLRFNEGFRDAESCVKTAERFNVLEDGAIARQDAAACRRYAQEISRNLTRATRLEAGLALTITHMRLSRDSGIVFFIVTLVLCGLFFNSMIASFIALLFISAMALGYIDRVLRKLLRKDIFGRGGKIGQILSETRH